MEPGEITDPLADALNEYRVKRGAFQTAKGAFMEADREASAAMAARDSKAAESNMAASEYGSAIDTLIAQLQTEKTALEA